MDDLPPSSDTADPADPAHAERTPVVRLLFELRDGRFEITDVTEVVKQVPPSAPLERLDDVSGAWLEVQDAAGAPIFRHDLSPTLMDGVEIFPEDPYGEIVRSSRLPDTTAFSVLAPLPDAAQRVVLIGPPARNSRSAARDIADIDAGEVRRRALGREAT